MLCCAEFICVKYRSNPGTMPYKPYRIHGSHLSKNIYTYNNIRWITQVRNIKHFTLKTLSSTVDHHQAGIHDPSRRCGLFRHAPAYRSCIVHRNLLVAGTLCSTCVAVGIYFLSLFCFTLCEVPKRACESSAWRRRWPLKMGVGWSDDIVL